MFDHQISRLKKKKNINIKFQWRTLIGFPHYSSFTFFMWTIYQFNINYESINSYTSKLCNFICNHYICIYIKSWEISQNNDKFSPYNFEIWNFEFSCDILAFVFLVLLCFIGTAPTWFKNRKMSKNNSDGTP